MRGWRSTCRGSIRLKARNDVKLAVSADATTHDLNGRYAAPELDEGLFEHRARRWQWGVCQCLATAIESVVFIARAVKSVMADAHKTARQHVEHEATDELVGR